jgi:AraC family transcriptional regulator
MPEYDLSDPECRLAVVDYAPYTRMPVHDHATLGLAIVLRGTVEETVGRTTEQAGAAGLVIKPPGTLHSNRFGPTGARLLSLEFRRSRAEELVSADALRRWRWLHDPAVLRLAAGALHRVSVLAPAAERGDALLSGLLELLAGETQRGDERRPPIWLCAVRDRLHAEYMGPCPVRELAREAGVHPVHLARVFRQHFGASVTRYLRAVRIRAAASRLGEPGTRIAEVAAAAGFTDQSHLCRAFRAAVGVPPSNYRALVRAG